MPDRKGRPTYNEYLETWAAQGLPREEITRKLQQLQLADMLRMRLQEKVAADLTSEEAPTPSPRGQEAALATVKGLDESWAQERRAKRGQAAALDAVKDLDAVQAQEQAVAAEMGPPPAPRTVNPSRLPPGVSLEQMAYSLGQGPMPPEEVKARTVAPSRVDPEIAAKLFEILKAKEQVAPRAPGDFSFPR